MGYSIEISFDLNKHKNYTSIKYFVQEEAEKNRSNSFYDFFEIEGAKRVERNRCVFSIYFDDPENCINFAKTIKKTKFLNIEIIFDDSHKIVYASSYYRQNKMTKEGRQIYKSQTYSGQALKIRSYLKK